MAEEVRHWYVRVTLGGEAVEPLLVRSALLRLAAERPFLSALRFHATGVQLEYWDEGADLRVVADLAARVWEEHRESAALPPWGVVALEVVERDLHDTSLTGGPLLAGGQELHPMQL